MFAGAPPLFADSLDSHRQARINGCAAVSHLNGAYAAFLQLKRPSAVAYASLMDACARAGEFGRSMHVYQRAVRRFVPPSAPVALEQQSSSARVLQWLTGNPLSSASVPHDPHMEENIRTIMWAAMNTLVWCGRTAEVRYIARRGGGVGVGVKNEAC